MRSAPTALREMLKASGRTPPLGPPWQTQEEERRQLKRLLSEVFLEGRLVAFDIEQTAFPVPDLIVPPTQSSGAVDASELIRESTPPAPQPSAPRNVNEDQQSCTLKDAAQQGVPFCEVCETLNRKLIA